MSGSSPPWSVSLPGTGTSGINAGSEGTVDDLQDAAFTVEAWMKQAVTQPDVTIAIWDKGYFASVGWLGYCGADGKPVASIQCATADAGGASTAAIRDGLWHHVAMCFDDAGDRKVYWAVDGVWVSAFQTAAVDAIISDAAQSLKFGTRATSPDWKYAGEYGWIRVSNNIRYTVGVNFTPAARSAPPASDANTVRLFKVNEGTGATLTDSSSNAQNATVTTGTWVQG